MSSWRRLRRRVLTPDVKETSVEVRGFHVKSPEARERLETVGRSFLLGYGLAAEARRPCDAEAGLERLPTMYKGFAYEGAAMALSMLDALPGGGRRHVAEFLHGRGGLHVYMAYVGVGWAMARLPRFRWSALHAEDPLLRWLILDGYGFHQAYFRTERYVHQQYRRDRFPWPGDGPAWYPGRVIDQGVGRAMWFVAGTDVDRLHTLLQRFDAHRHPDLYSGAGLAATYAGGAGERDLHRLRDLAGEHAGDLAQGSSFAAGARVRAGLLVPHNEVATRVFCGRSPVECSAVNDEAREGLTDTPQLPAYEAWRQRIRATYSRSDGAATRGTGVASGEGELV